MGNDSGVRKKNKQRTTIHKKHTPYPSMKLGKDVKLEFGSIRPINRITYSLPQPATKKTDATDPLWAAYDRATAGLANGSNSSKAINNGVERVYELAYRKLVRAGKAPKIKRKYSKV